MVKTSTAEGYEEGLGPAVSGTSFDNRKEDQLSILWIILIVILVLALLGFLGFR